MIGPGLQKTKLDHDKRQDATTFNQRSDRQA